MKVDAERAIRLVRSRLPGGLEVAVAPLPHLHSTSVVFAVRAGSRYERPQTNGISHFVEHLLFRGTTRRPSLYALNAAFENLGASLTASTHVDFTQYQLRLPPEALADGLELLGEMMSSPRLGDIEIEREIVREEMLEGLDEKGRDVDADDVSRGLLFGGHPLGFKIEGRAGNIRRFGPRLLRAFLRRHYTARNAALAIAGPVQPARVLRRAASAFRHLPPGRRLRPRPAPRPTSNGPRFRFVSSRGSQTDVRISFPTFGERDARATALQLLRRVIDDGMSSPLHRRVCTEGALAYDAWARLDVFEDTGVLDFGTAVEHRKTAAVVREILALCRDLKHALPSDEQLERARRRYAFQMRTSLDDDLGVATFYATTTLFRLPYTIESLVRDIEQVHPRRLRELARGLLRRERLHLTCVGAPVRRASIDIDALG